MRKLDSLIQESFFHSVMRCYAALNSPRCHHVVHKTASANHAFHRYGLKVQSTARTIRPDLLLSSLLQQTRSQNLAVGEHVPEWLGDSGTKAKGSLLVSRGTRDDRSSRNTFSPPLHRDERQHLHLSKTSSPLCQLRQIRLTSSTAGTGTGEVNRS